MGGAEVFLLEYEEENGKPAPPVFRHHRDGRTVCWFDLHLDDSWSIGQVDRDLELPYAIRELLSPH